MSMKRTFLKKRTALAVLAVALGLGVMVGSTLAYYTDTTEANGSIPFSLTPETPPPPVDPEEPEEPTPPPPGTEIQEKIEGTNKIIHVENVGKTDVAVRVRAFYGTANATVEFAGEGWGTRAEGDGEEGWLYGRTVLKPDEVSDALYIKVEPVKNAQVDSFDIAIVQQCVVPDEVAEGKPAAATFADGTVVLDKLTPLPAYEADDQAEGEDPEAGAEGEGEEPAARAALAAAAAVEGLVPVADEAAQLVNATVNPGVRA